MKKIYLDGDIGVNCYIIEHENHLVVIDPGSDFDTLNKAINGRIVDYILLTHGHADHIGLIGKFKCPIYVSKEDNLLLKDEDLSCFSMLDALVPFDYSALDVRLIDDGDEIPFFDSFFKVVKTPGHTAGSVCFLYKSNLFSGDTLFCQSVGRTDLPTGNSQALKKSILRLFKELSDEISVYPGHDETTSIKMERKTNPYYLTWKKSIK